MAGSKSRIPSEQMVEKWIRAGYGQGEGSEYKPFLFVRDVPSIGTSSMVKSWITKRTHHYLSRQEFKAHLISHYQPGIVDIREQYALLPRAETQSISESIGVRYPTYPGSQTPIVMTTDLVVTLKKWDGLKVIAFSVKLSKDLNERNLEKLLIERLYWEQRGIKWALITEKNIPRFLSQNLEFFENSLNDERVNSCHINPIEFSREFERNHCETHSFNQIMSLTSRRMNVDIATGHSLLGVAVWQHESRLSIHEAPISHRGCVRLSPAPGVYHGIVCN